MNNEELEESIQYLMVSLNKKNLNGFVLDKKIKKLLQEFDMFKEIISNFPDKYNTVLTELIPNLTLKKYKKNEVIFDNSIKNLTDIYIIFIGEINIIYNSLNEEMENTESKELKINDKDIDIMIKGREIFGKKYLLKKFKVRKVLNEEGELIDDENCFFKIISKSKSSIGILKEELYLDILEKYKTKERLEQIYFLQNIKFLPKEQNFIEKFQKVLIKRCYPKNSIIAEQNGEIKSIFLIISGSLRLSIVFNKKIYCSLDYGVLIGKFINERFSSLRKFEITGNYREKENIVILDIGEGEILGGIEFCKNLKNYLFKIKCMTNVILYEINIENFQRFINSWSMKGFYNKINRQLNFLKQRFSHIRNLEKEKSKKDDYNLSENKFITTYEKGHPVSTKAKESIKKYTNPFKFGKQFKSKEFKIKNTRYGKTIDIKKFKEIQKKPTKKINIRRNNPFITNLINENLSQEISFNRSRSLSSIINLKSSKNKTKVDLDDLFNKTKENMKKEEEKIKKIRMNNMKFSSINASQKNKYNNRRRLNSYKLGSNMKIKISRNLFGTGQKLSNTSMYKDISNKNNIQKRLKMSVDNINFMKNELNDEENKNTFIKFKNLSSKKIYNLIPSRDFNLILQRIRKLSQPSINKKKLTFPYGIQEISDQEGNNINDIINKIFDNRLIKKEFLLNSKVRKSEPITPNQKSFKIK